MKPSDIRFEESDPGGETASRCLDAYYAELGRRFEEGFDVSRSLSADPGEFRRPNGVFLIAYLEDRAIGCGGVKLTSKEVGYIKRMWIDATHRGHGLGRALLKALEETARSLGCRVAQLETNRSLTGAIELYRTSGYRETAPFNDEYYAHHWFEKDLSVDE